MANSVNIEIFRKAIEATPREAWLAVLQEAWKICSEPLPEKTYASEIVNRDNAISSLDLLLTAPAWNLWFDYYDSVNRTADRLEQWWNTQMGGRAVLLLDGLSLREAPWIIEGAKTRGYTVHADFSCSELPGDTNSFAKALNFGHRSSLENNKIPSTSRLKNATSDTSASNWIDCIPLVNSQPNWIFWHHWPDNRIHELGGLSGKGLSDLTKEVAMQLSDDSFWSFVERLTTGRKLIITSDHGYAAAGLFPDVSEPHQAAYLKTTFASGRFVHSGNAASGNWLPPLDLMIANASTANCLVLGRRRWKSQGGYPTLTHGGLTILECASPFIELSR